MPKVSPLQSSFNTGELSPLLQGRVDADRYKAGLAVCKNYLPAIQGFLPQRPGTMFVAGVKDSTKKTRLVAFEFSITQAYILEFGHHYIRFFKDNGQILSSGVPYEISTTYNETDLFQLKFTQSADVLYIVHPTYAPMKLSRTGDTSWTLTQINFLDGPYLPQNITSVTLIPGAATGTGVTIRTGPSDTITGAANNGSGLIRIASTGHGYLTGDKVHIAGVTGTTEANGDWTVTVIDADHFDLQGSAFVHAYTAAGTSRPALFASGDVGRLIRLKEGSTWGWVKIVTFVDSSNITADIQTTLTNTNAKTAWRLGAWSTTTGFPGCIVFHEDRLCPAGATSFPQRIDGSRSGDYENFAPSDLDGTITSSHAISYNLNSSDVNVLRWVTSDEKGLLAGSVSGEWVVRPANPNEALSPTNVSAKRATSYGSANIQPVQVGRATLFIQRAGRKLREFTYFFDVDGFKATDLTIISEHITQSGIVQMAYQKEPQSFVWAVREDGVLAVMTYDRDLDTLKVGWSRQILGGYSDAGVSDAIVESVACIPAPDGTRDDVWVVVKRYINGAVVRYVEYLTKLFQDTDEQKDAFFVDCGLTYDNPLTVSGITRANPAVLTATAHGFNNGDRVKVSGVLGMTEVNDVVFTVANKTANTFELSGINSSAYGVYVSGGEARKLVTTISGLDHLEGETVSILADGAVQPTKVVATGAITLSVPAGTVQIGYGYHADGQMLRLEAGAADGTALGKTRRTHRVGFLLHRTLGLKIGTDFNSLDRITFRSTSDPMSRAPELFSGIISETIQSDYDFENQIAWRNDQPLPSTILAVMPQMVTQDRG